MIDFLKKLFEQRHKRITVIMLDNTAPDEDNSYKLKPNRIFGLVLGISGLIIMITAVAFMLTPLGGLLYSSDEANIRQQIMNITERTIALEDSLNKRDRQLQEMKNVIRMSVDTTLKINQRFVDALNEGNFDEVSDLPGISESGTFDDINQYEILSAAVLKSIPIFPARYPVKGTVSRVYLPVEDHFGMDIATKDNEPVLNIADGSVINSSWTFNNGYVISVQHKEGIITIYKHLSRLNKKEGDIVLKGDILGTTGNKGVLSSGPHLHFEIWKDGVPQNPQLYLIK